MLAFGVLAGETTVGRTDDQDVTISDPSVSGSHAAIDVVELPGGGGKRLTLKVGLRSSGRRVQPMRVLKARQSWLTLPSPRPDHCWGLVCSRSPRRFESQLPRTQTSFLNRELHGSSRVFCARLFLVWPPRNVPAQRGLTYSPIPAAPRGVQCTWLGWNRRWIFLPTTSRTSAARTAPTLSTPRREIRRASPRGR